ncbi:MAG: hypothetical protein ACREE6_10625, partial [Limisphaerales bacterium]
MQAVQLNPGSEKLAAQRALIGQKYADYLLQQSTLLSTNNLPGNIDLLTKASQLECTNRVSIAAALSALEEERQAMIKHAESLETTDVDDMVTGTEQIQNFIQFDEDLRKMLIENTAVVAKVEGRLNELDAACNFRDERRIAIRSENLWSDENLKTIESRAVAKLHEQGFQQLLQYQNPDPSLGDKMVCCLIKAILAGDERFD